MQYRDRLPRLRDIYALLDLPPGDFCRNRPHYEFRSRTLQERQIVYASSTASLSLYGVKLGVNFLSRCHLWWQEDGLPVLGGKRSQVTEDASGMVFLPQDKELSCHVRRHSQWL